MIIISIVIFYLALIIKILVWIHEAFPEPPPHSTGVGGDEEWANSCLVLKMFAHSSLPGLKLG